MNDYLRAGFTRAIRRLISRAVINDQNVVQFLARSADDVANVLFLVVSGNDRRSS